MQLQMPGTKNTEFSRNELERYSRQMAIPSFGNGGQKKLKNARVAVIGAGGLGAPLLQYLAAAGVGTIGIFDFDHVEISNLQRQILFQHEDAGKQKAASAGKKLQQINPHIHLEIHNQKISPANAVSLLKDYDVAADGSDNFLTRYVVNDACLILDIPLVYGSVYQFEGQVSVFNHAGDDGNRGPDYRDLFPEMPDEGFIPNCAQAGVIGALPGIIGSIQALEVIKIITGIGKVLSGSMLVLDGLSMEFSKMNFPVTSKKQKTGKDVARKRLESLSRIYPENSSGTDCATDETNVPEITPHELQTLMQKGEDVTLIDVRTPAEHNEYNIGGELIPLNQLKDHLSKIPGKKKTVIYCASGIRSTEAIKLLQSKNGYKNLYNLNGGMVAWQRKEEVERKGNLTG